MIIPATVIKLIGFKDGSSQNSTIYPTCQPNTNTMIVQTDSMDIIELPILPTESNFSNSLMDFLDFKTRSSIKSSDIQKISHELAFTSDQNILNSIQTLFIQNKQNNMTDQQARKLATETLAKQLVYQKRSIKAASILRLPIAIASKNGINTYNSKSMQVITKKDTADKEWGTGGIYFMAQTDNALPVEINPIYNKEGSFVGFFKVTTSSLINAGQIHFLIQHSIRTVVNLLNKNKKPFLIQLLNQGIHKTIPQEFLHLAKTINDVERKNREQKNTILAREEYDKYIISLQNLEQLLRSNPYNYQFFKASLPFLLTQGELEKMIYTVGVGGKSPLQRLSQSLVDLNFSKENYNIKEEGRKFVRNYVGSLHLGHFNFKLLTTYNFPAIGISSEESDSWGFMSNNVSPEKMVMSYSDTINLYYGLEQLINNLKSVNN